jgi:hypothetical protein
MAENHSEKTSPISIRIVGKATRTETEKFDLVDYDLQVTDAVTGRIIPNILAIEFPILNGANSIFPPEVKITLLVDEIDLELGVSAVQELSGKDLDYLRTLLGQRNQVSLENESGADTFSPYASPAGADVGSQSGSDSE